MSNLYICGSREITVNKTSVVELQHCNYRMWQTPVSVTKRILDSSDPATTYKEWVMQQMALEITFNTPATIECESIEECNQVDEWIAAVTNLGYELEFIAI